MAIAKRSERAPVAASAQQLATTLAAQAHAAARSPTARTPYAVEYAQSLSAGPPDRREEDEQAPASSGSSRSSRRLSFPPLFAGLGPGQWLQRLLPRGGKMDDITVVVAFVA